MEFKKMLITPSVARDILESNIRNRPLRSVDVNRYANEMKEGRWKSNTAEMIKISKTGLVLDGQHRLNAVIKSNSSIFFHVATGLEDDVFDVLDTGKVRNASDVFSIEGIKKSNAIPSIITRYTLLKRGVTSVGQKDMRPTNKRLLELYYENENHWQHVASKAYNWYCGFAKILPPSTIGSLYSFFMDVSKDDAERFMSQLCRGVDISNRTIENLRIKLMQDKMSTQKKMSPKVKDALIIKTWNHFRTGKEVKLIKFDTEREKFPKPI